MTTDDETWNLKLKWGPKTHPQLPIIAISAAKDNEMKIFEIINLSQYNQSSHVIYI